MEDSIEKKYQLLYDEIEKLGVNSAEIKKLYHIDEATGEVTAVLEEYPLQMLERINDIKAKQSKILKFVMLYQEPEISICRELSNAEYKLFGFFRAMMKFENRIEITVGEIHKHIGLSTATIVKAIRKLELKNLIIKTKNKNGFIYTMNPVSSWKGKFYKRIAVFKQFEKSAMEELNEIGQQMLERKKDESE